MIVRDEAALLPRFLAAASGAWDELCVVDTGSTDATPSILQAAGAAIRNVSWRDDFSAARNESLQMATAAWVLILDADEIVNPPMITALRSLAARAEVGAATLDMRNAMPGGHERQARLLRVFRNHPSIRFRYRIHEDVGADVSAYLTRTGLSLAHLDGYVDHLGYDRDLARARGKKERDRRLLELAVGEDPNDLYCWFKLLELASVWNDAKLLAEVARRVSPRVDRERARLAGLHFGGEMIALLARGLYGADDRRALAFLDRWASELRAHVSFRLLSGELRERIGDRTGAETEFNACLALPSRGNLQLYNVRPRMGLARLAFAAGDAKSARLHVEAALEVGPLDREALLLALILARASGGSAEIERFACSHRERHGSSFELRQALADEGAFRGTTA